ncbi:hypothetical protein N7537_003189 [Penicillium hordei]|uniref:CFEM domain-containing protein n=1 Tax=Penicillium hordei TaxID=40994 RepID=A0AAD6H9J0_9EURO|nr:uncharacterized protein N7537_003189 [Penicillium hordei]KAJ5618075.1 hypothetical protein N7537_003189 [Penicillium hordei]
MKLTIFFPLAAFLSLTIAGPSDDASPCLNRCLSEASVVAGCVSSVDYECTCPSEAFKDALGTCLKDSCTSDDLTAAGELHKERCGGDPPQ